MRATKALPSQCIYMYFKLVEKIETNLHLELPSYLLTKIWKYGGSVFGSEDTVGAQTQ